jgi:transketolase
MAGVNLQGCQVFSFKQPSAEELGHDFLWRTTCPLPERSLTPGVETTTGSLSQGLGSGVGMEKNNA